MATSFIHTCQNFNAMKTKLVGLLFFGLFALTACSSDSKTVDEQENTSEPNSVDSITRISSLSESIDSSEGVVNIGWFRMDELESDQLIFANAVFFEVNGNMNNPVSNFLNRPGDSCVVKQTGSATQIISNQVEDGFRTISAGEVVTMFEEGEEFKYSELGHRGLADEGRYISYMDMAFPSPEALNVSAVGEAFSAFSLTLDKPATTTGLSIVNGQPVALGATIRWNASEVGDTMLNLVLEETNDSFATFVIDCMVIDDGEFTLPADMDIAAGAQTRLQSANRLSTTSTRVGNDLVVLMRGADLAREI